jgi:predicted  nucleic acid-binding Zn-ribbon protein
MSDILELLQKLQEIDYRRDNLKQRIAKRTREGETLEEEKRRIEEELRLLKQALEQARLALARKELELKEAEEKWATTKNKLYSGEITSSKELAQWEKSMKKLEETKSLLEDEMLLEMENVENLEREFREKTKLSSEREKDLTQRIASIETEIAALRSDLASLEAERESIAALLPPEILTRYEDLRKKFPNAVVPLAGEVCEGCHLTVPTVVAKAVRRKEGVVGCPNCGRFLR